MDRVIKFFVWGVAISVLLPYLVDRRLAYTLLVTNTPSKLREMSAFKSYKIKFPDVLRNCEDVLLDEELGIAYLSCDPGRDWWNAVMGTFNDPNHLPGKLYYYEYAKYDLEENGVVKELPIEGWSKNPRHQSTFHNLGIGYDKDNHLLYVVSHADAGPAIEVFQINSKGNKAVWKKTLTHDLMHTPNSVLPLSEHEILFTNDHMFKVENYPTLALIETYSAYPGGSLIYFNTKTQAAHKLANVPFANGIGLLNNTHIAVSSTTLPAVLIYGLSEKRDSIILKQRLRPRFCADNLRVDSDGKLLIAGHPHGPTLSVVAKKNRFYDIDGTGEAGLLPAKDRPRSPSWVVEWDGNVDGTLTDLYIGHDFGTSTTAARDSKRGIGIIGGLYEKGVLVWKD